LAISFTKASQNLFKGGKGGKKGDHLTRSYEL
jgi:hypothetical protein